MDGTLLDLDFDNRFWLEIVPQRYARLHGMTWTKRCRPHSTFRGQGRHARVVLPRSLDARPRARFEDLNREHRQHIGSCRARRISSPAFAHAANAWSWSRTHIARRSRSRPSTPVSIGSSKRQLLARLLRSEGERRRSGRRSSGASRSTRSARCCSRTICRAGGRACLRNAAHRRDSPPGFAASRRAPSPGSRRGRRIRARLASASATRPVASARGPRRCRRRGAAAARPAGGGRESAARSAARSRAPCGRTPRPGSCGR